MILYQTGAILMYMHVVHLNNRISSGKYPFVSDIPESIN